MQFCEEYHAKRGERQITRPSLIPSDVDTHKEKLQGVLTNLLAKAEDERLASVKRKRQQLIVIWRALNLVGGSVFDDLAASCKAAAAATCAELEKAYVPLARDRSRKREMHELALKPTLRNAGNQKELKALAHAEADRSASVVSAATELRDAMLAAESEQADSIVTRLVHLSALLLRLLDACIASDDLTKDDAPPEDVHYGVKKHLRIETREKLLAASEDVKKDGRPYGTHVWPGLPLGELTAAKCGAEPPAATGGEGEEAEGGAEGAAADAGAKGAEGGAEVSPELQGNVERTVNQQSMRAHRSVVAARDRVYASYKLHYTGRVRQIQSACEAILSEERQWEASWKKLVARIEIV